MPRFLLARAAPSHAGLGFPIRNKYTSSRESDINSLQIQRKATSQTTYLIPQYLPPLGLDSLGPKSNQSTLRRLQCQDPVLEFRTAQLHTVHLDIYR